jgi:hypothetical protein
MSCDNTVLRCSFPYLCISYSQIPCKYFLLCPEVPFFLDSPLVPYWFCMQSTDHATLYYLNCTFQLAITSSFLLVTCFLHVTSYLIIPLIITLSDTLPPFNLVLDHKQYKHILSQRQKLVSRLPSSRSAYHHFEVWFQLELIKLHIIRCNPNSRSSRFHLTITNQAETDQSTRILTGGHVSFYTGQRSTNCPVLIISSGAISLCVIHTKPPCFLFVLSVRYKAVVFYSIIIWPCSDTRVYK